MSDEETKEEKELDLSSPEVVTKYKSAAEIINKALQLVVSECKPNAKVVDICEKGDAFIREQTGNMYKNVKKKIERGVAFPTCISINNTVCHFSPLASDEMVLQQGDILKIDMGCHIDGFIVVAAHTHVLQEGPVSGRAADAIAAANTAAEVALRLVRPGKKVNVIHFWRTSCLISFIYLFFHLFFCSGAE
ncbi:ERBB-3 BINDING PROTEIN 1-like [Macadamia integrifolia]|uniref:ERBB-3 BINDING PROTEIN 1-like n=1 Tax=Macadamia integrifolia TaxID=60698 RepID=UPI001C4FD564|nr:ERBB-3 BINDING PROTEIN 1-like [Macadamia integrifolia]XP_042512581.1 ERBB-3 BINDING PROTEIN 1-like [Macadamia integrifolia]XP_042512582.1 ERBB-3 BINDING PROTEIN 1-like [Macadamia integrifolia]